jgi:hypothetical protein
MITSKTNSPSTTRKMWTTTATHLKTGVETSQQKVTSTLEIDETNMGRNQSTATQSGEQIKLHNKQV